MRLQLSRTRVRTETRQTLRQPDGSHSPTTAQLLRYGDIGVGSFDDGDLMIANGHCYTLLPYGSAIESSRKVRASSAAVTRFLPEETLVVTRPHSLEQLTTQIDRLFPDDAVVGAIRIDAWFSFIRLGAPFAAGGGGSTARKAPVQELSDVMGTIVGLRNIDLGSDSGPRYPAYRLHFIDDQRKRGRRVSDFEVFRARASVAPGSQVKPKPVDSVAQHLVSEPTPAGPTSKLVDQRKGNPPMTDTKSRSYGLPNANSQRHEVSEGFIGSTQLIDSLQEVLVDLIELHIQGKQAHWNVVGKNFRDLHLQIDEIVDAAREFSDDVAERMRSIHGTADGRSDTVVATTTLPQYPAGEQSTSTTVDLITSRLDGTVATIRRVHDTVDAADPTSADLLHSVITRLEQLAWMASAENRVVS